MHRTAQILPCSPDNVKLVPGLDAVLEKLHAFVKAERAIVLYVILGKEPQNVPGRILENPGMEFIILGKIYKSAFGIDKNPASPIVQIETYFAFIGLDYGINICAAPAFFDLIFIVNAIFARERAKESPVRRRHYAVYLDKTISYLVNRRDRQPANHKPAPEKQNSEIDEQ